MGTPKKGTPKIGKPPCVVWKGSDSRPRSGRTPLLAAVRGGRVALVRTLCEPLGSIAWAHNKDCSILGSILGSMVRIMVDRDIWDLY